ncbi:MAG: methionyl-tRNA formyltransferase, partial [Lachnospiraceae bacterium]
ASTYASMLKKEMGCIDWNMPADKIERLVRGLNSWPGAYTFMNGKMLKIWGSAVTDMQAQGEPGTVAGTDKKAIYVNCKDSVLALTEVQYEGKKRMPVQAFLLGARIEEGQKLTAER